MVSIVSLEYAYTQAPRTMKSFIMCLYLGAVALGNVLVVGVSHYIQIPDSAATQLEQAVAKLPADWRKDPRTIILPGFDGITGTQDDLIQRLKQGEPLSLEIPGQSTFEKAAAAIETRMKQTGALPDEKTGNTLIRSLKDPWDQQITYQIINSSTARIQTPGPDRTPRTPRDMGLLIQRKEPEPDKKPSWTDRLRPEKPWLETRKQQLGIKDPESTAEAPIRPAFVGGQSRLQGAAYFQFFTWLMLGTALLFIPYALLYRPRTYLQD